MKFHTLKKQLKSDIKPFIQDAKYVYTLIFNWKIEKRFWSPRFKVNKNESRILVKDPYELVAIINTLNKDLQFKKILLESYSDEIGGHPIFMHADFKLAGILVYEQREVYKNNNKRYEYDFVWGKYYYKTLKYFWTNIKLVYKDMLNFYKERFINFINFLNKDGE